MQYFNEYENDINDFEEINKMINGPPSQKSFNTKINKFNYKKVLPNTEVHNEIWLCEHTYMLDNFHQNIDFSF